VIDQDDQTFLPQAPGLRQSSFCAPSVASSNLMEESADQSPTGQSDGPIQREARRRALQWLALAELQTSLWSKES